MTKKELFIYFAIASIILVLVIYTNSQKTRMDASTRLNDALIHKFEKTIADKDKRIKNDSLSIVIKIDSLKRKISDTELQMVIQQKKFKKQIDDIKKIKTVGDFSNYNDSLELFIQSMRHE
jgi:hypothetical protein